MMFKVQLKRKGPVLFAAAWMACILSCNVTDRNLGDAPVGPQGNPNGSLDTLAGGWVKDSTSRNMSVFVSPHVLKAGNKDKATVTVQVFDVNHNPVAGKAVRFAASLGSITASGVTDSAGKATAQFSSAPRNGEAHILAAATMDDSLTVVGTSVLLAGLTVDVIPLSPDTAVGSNLPVDVTVADGDGEPVASASVSLTGAKDASGITNAAGTFRTGVTRGSEGVAEITAAALGAADSVGIVFWTTPPVSRSRTLLVFADPSRLPAANGETSRIRAVLFDDKHNPIANKPISFSASNGIVTPSGVTDSSGSASAVFQAVAMNADAVITASYKQGESLQSASATVSLVGLQMEINAPATEALLGDTVPLSLRVRDASGRVMPGVQIVLKGASQSSVVTSSSGTAAASVTSSEEKSVTVSATSLGGSDSVKILFLKTLPGSDTTRKVGVGNMRIFAEHSDLRASNTDQTVIKVVAFDKFNNPLAGRPVRFTATTGIITATDTTDAKGEATAVYRAVPFNTNARVTASMTVDDSALAVATTVTLAGLEILVKPQVSQALLNKQVPVTISIIDGAGNPVPDVNIKWNGNPGVGTTDGKGEFNTSVTSGTEKNMSITAEALGASGSGSISFFKTLGSTGEVNTIRKMRIFSSRSQLRADNSDFAVITVILTNENNNPAAGESVKFTGDLGIINQTSVVDSAGRATAILHSAPVNGVCHVVATAVGRNLSASTDVIFSGVTLKLLPDRTDLKIGELVSLEAFLKDASGNPIGGDAATFTASGAGIFDDSAKSFTASLNPNGRALVRVTALSSGKVSVRAAALNTSDSVDLRFSNNSLSLAAAKSLLAVGGGDSTLVTATYVDGSNNPVANAVIVFAANAGKITRDSVSTDVSGKATTFLKSANFTGVATVQANAPGGVAQAKVSFLAALPKTLKLTISPDNIAVNGGLATLKAVVTDAQGNMVSDQDVNFRIIKGPGGGENVIKPVVATQGGEALSQLASGTVSSQYRGVVVVASIGNLSDTSKLTISGPAHIVTVSRPEDDSIDVPSSGVLDESTFEMFIGAVAQDINGNFVADGTEVHFSAVVTGMAVTRRVLDHWQLNSDPKPIYKDYVMDIPFEDINDNLKYDPDIDLNLDDNPLVLRRGEDRNGDGVFDWNPAVHDFWFDINGNGKCDPGVGEDDTVDVGGKTLYADLNGNGVRDHSEIITDAGTPGVCDEPGSGDFPYGRWDVRNFLPDLPFRDNQFAVAIEVSAVTTNGVAHARLRYPRQFAERLFVTVNAEANGVRDRDGERFILRKVK
jgi:hypothetical protein